MPARTLKAIPDLLAHVPVDQFDIVDGPTLAHCFQLKDTLENGIIEYVDRLFTLKTLASDTPFKRKIRLATIFAVETDGSFQFTGFFSGKLIYGGYNPKKRSGWLHFD